MNKVPSRRAHYFLSTYLSMLTTNAFTRVWVKPQTINRVALSRKMAALPQQEGLQLQPALTQSLDRPMAQLLKCQETKICDFALWSSISKYCNLAKTETTCNLASGRQESSWVHTPVILPRNKLGAATRTEHSNVVLCHCLSQPMLLLLSSLLRTKREREEGILLR